MTADRTIGIEIGGGRYDAVRDRVETYFDATATEAWTRLTSTDEVSRIRRTVRAGRDRMRALILTRLPADLTGTRILDAGCGVGQMTAELCARGADVTAVDVSPRLLDVARERHPDGLPGRACFVAGDMFDSSLGSFDHVVAMDSMIYYGVEDLCSGLAQMSERTRGLIVFTVAPRTPLLMTMWTVGKLFPRTDRAPVMVPQSPRALAAALSRAGCVKTAKPAGRVNSGFYFSACMEVGA